MAKLPQSYSRNLVLFNDGQTAGQITVTDRDMHAVHLMVLDAFMARPEFFLASEAVRTAFVKHREEHLAGMGAFPNEMPYAEEGAEESNAQIDELQRLVEGGGAGAVPAPAEEGAI